jgi:hypothetical protein
MPEETDTPSDIFRSVMEKAKQRLLLESAEAGDFRHEGIRGDERAASLAEFFRERLPTNLGVEKGEAIDYRDARTGQIALRTNHAGRLGAIVALALDLARAFYEFGLRHINCSFDLLVQGGRGQVYIGEITLCVGEGLVPQQLLKHW